MVNAIPRKVILAGNDGSGKTTLLFRYTRGVFAETFVPTVYELCVQEITLPSNPQVYALALWDTSQYEEFDRIRILNYADGHAVIICFGIDNRVAFDAVKYMWISEVRKNLPKASVILVGCKSDLRKGPFHSETGVISSKEGLAMAKDIGADCYLECSAQTDEGIQEVFEMVIKLTERFGNGNKKKCVVM